MVNPAGATSLQSGCARAFSQRTNKLNRLFHCVAGATTGKAVAASVHGPSVARAHPLTHSGYDIVIRLVLITKCF
jgi:hypothetical protein